MINLTQNLPLSGFLRLPEVLKLIPVSKSAWWEGVARGIYPKPIKLSARTTAWRVKDIQEFIDQIDRVGSPCFKTDNGVKK